jgi:hypothetical protein
MGQASDPADRARYAYRVSFTLGPATHAPAFGPAIARLLDVLKRAGYDATTEIVQIDPEPPA